MQETTVPLGEASVSASVHGTGGTVLILGHGAGGTRRTPALRRLAEAVAATGRRALLYNFPYAERGSRQPDPPARLEATTRAVGAWARERLGASRVVHGGRSMGGRIASQAVAAGEPASGLVLLAYPLHAPGRPQQLRDGHLPRIAAPMLFVQGTRDAFARLDLLLAVLGRLGERATFHRVEEGDHSFAVPVRSGRRPLDVEAEVHGAVLAWLGAQGL
jgi:predicted alpha/beta-hydrolase family hydrolase